MIINPKTQDLDFQSDVNDLLCQIDKRLSGDAKSRLDYFRYGAKNCVNKDLFFVLKNYRSILISKASNSCCLSNYSIDDIMSNIKQLLKSGRIVKVCTKTDTCGKDPCTTPEVQVTNKYYGDNITYNSEINKTIIKKTDWTQIEW